MSESNEHKANPWAILVDALQIGVVIANNEGVIDYVNKKAAEIFKLEHTELIGQPFGFPINRDSKTEIEVIHADLSYTIAEIQIKLGFWMNRQSWVITLTDITERRNNEEQLNIAAGVFKSSHESIMITDINGGIIDVNKGFENTLGYSKEEVLGKNVNIIKSGRHSKDFYFNMFQQLKSKGCWQGEIWDRHKKGKIIPMILDISSVLNMNGETVFYVGILHDISLIKKQENQLKTLALYDSLTKLPNLNLLNSEIELCLNQHKGFHHPFLVVYMDIDKFQCINLQHGVAYGDKVLKHIANMLIEFVGHLGMVSRVSGDEFVILMRTHICQQSCQVFLRNLLVKMNRIVKINEKKIKISCSIGYVLAPLEDVDSPGQIIRQAESAMFEAKIKGGNQVNEYNLDAVILKKNSYSMIKEITKGLSAGEFIMYYQPKVQMNTGKVVGAEALVRWHHPKHGVCLPGFFLPYIDTRVEMRQLSSLVFNQVLGQLSQWLKQGIDLKISINISAEELQNAGFLKRMKQKLSLYENKLNRYLELELLETSAVKDIEYVSELISKCHQIGLSLSLDDFGTGYSSLSYLKRLNVDTVKIDQSFVNEVMDNTKAIAILDSIVYLCEKFNQSLVAEGIDSHEKGLILLQLGCEQGQGFFIGKPMLPDEFVEWWRTWKAPDDWLKQQKVGTKLKELVYARAMILTLKNRLMQQNINQFLEQFNQHFYFRYLNHWASRSDGQESYSIGSELMETKCLIQRHIEALGDKSITPSQKRLALKELNNAIEFLIKQISWVLENGDRCFMPRK
jgi:diguanylate cyclase (GGDEF)-like protein/PAS domain S-box-containing protein